MTWELVLIYVLRLITIAPILVAIITFVERKMKKTVEKCGRGVKVLAISPFTSGLDKQVLDNTVIQVYQQYPTTVTVAFVGILCVGAVSCICFINSGIRSAITYFKNLNESSIDGKFDDDVESENGSGSDSD